MCGIVGYIGSKDAYPIVLTGLKRLEYRGYDSAGIALVQDGQTTVYKKQGKVADLESYLEGKNTSGNIGMGHTRWATHGEPNDVNAHPHTSMNGKFTVIHNGIIENYNSLKKKLTTKNYTFKSETDTEVIANYIEFIYQKGKGKISAEVAVRLALLDVQGAYGLVVICADEMDKLIVARKGSPLVIGVGDGEYFVASDATPIVEHTKRIIYLNDSEMATITKNELSLKTIKNDTLTPVIQELELDIEGIEKGG
ncbi:MAG: glutamine--fructose-6-phosphate aminotransferase, partial [Bacteroidales bacterium]|nr:glutamine--fructose-6-phosphate aminotransferase [Bacteroidales bacterium]